MPSWIWSSSLVADSGLGQDNVHSCHSLSWHVLCSCPMPRGCPWCRCIIVYLQFIHTHLIIYIYIIHIYNMHSCMLWVWLLQFHQIEIVLHVTLLHYVHMSFTGHSTSRRWTTRAPQVLPEGSATQPAELLEKLQNALPKDRWLGKHTGFKKSWFYDVSWGFLMGDPKSSWLLEDVWILSHGRMTWRVITPCIWMICVIAPCIGNIQRIYN